MSIMDYGAERGTEKLTTINKIQAYVNHNILKTDGV